MDGARRINVLDGHYQTVDCIESNKDKIHSVVVHVSNELVVGAIDKLDISKSVEFEIELEWENKLLGWTKYPIWIGIDKIVEELNKLANEHGEFYKPDPLLISMQ